MFKLFKLEIQVFGFEIFRDQASFPTYFPVPLEATAVVIAILVSASIASFFVLLPLGESFFLGLRSVVSTI
jgi:hypothetical protein